MQRKILVLLLVPLVAVVGLVAAQPAYASEFISDEVITIDSDIVDDVYAFGDTVVVNAVIDGDLLAFGGTIIINGEVTGDVIAAAQSLEVNGPIGDDLRYGGYGLVFGDGGSVGDDVNFGGYALDSRDGRINGDLFGGGAQFQLGDVAGSVFLGAGAVEVAGDIAGDANFQLGEVGGQAVNPAQFAPPEANLPVFETLTPGLTFDGGSIAGNLDYAATRQIEFPQGAGAGAVDFSQVETGTEDFTGPDFEGAPGPNPVVAFFRWVGGLIGSFAIVLLFGVAMQQITPNFLENTVETLRERVAASFGVGLATYAVYILLLIMLAILFIFGIGLAIVGADVSLFGALSYLFTGSTWALTFTGSWLAVVIVSVLLGRLIIRAVNNEARMPFWSLVVGLVIVTFLTAIPFLGTFFLSGLVALFGVGAVVLTLWPSKQQAPVETGPAADRPVVNETPSESEPRINEALGAG
ncbi:MAG: hypothetical protein ACFB51_09665 [Anaerolineae bacterium]